MSVFRSIRRKVYWIEILLLIMLIVPTVHAQDSSNQLLYAVADDKGDNTIYTLNVDIGEKTQIGIVHQFGSEAGWSPDGKFIYFLDNTGASQPMLTLVDVETKQRQTIPERLQESPCSPPLWWSPDGQWLAYATQSDSQIFLKIFNTQNGNIQTLPDAALSYGEVSWSPDGRYLAYRTASQPVSDKVAIIDMETQRTVVQAIASSYDFLQWSPTENRIAFVATESLQATIYNLADDTKQEYEGDRIGSWSPDGQFVTVYRQNQAQETLLSIIDVPANATVEFDGDMNQAYVDTNAAWSSDGRYLALASIDTSNEYKRTLYVVDVAARSSQQLKLDPLLFNKMMWSPVGHTFAFASNLKPTDSGDIYTVLWLFDVDHQQSQQYSVKIPLYFYEQTLNWSSAGRYLIVRTASSVALLDQVSGKLNRIEKDSQSFFLPRWSPDGTRLALSSRISDFYDIYIFTPEDKALRNITNTPDESETFLGWRGDKRGEILSFCGEG